MSVTFPLRTRWWSRPLLGLFTRAPLEARLEPDALHVDLGWIGHAVVPVRGVARVSTMQWPWWGGVGARIGRGGLVAFVAAPGPTVVLELADPLEVRAPLRWAARRVGIGAEDVRGLAAAIAAARSLADEDGAGAGDEASAAG